MGIKQYIRSSEAKISVGTLGIPPERVHCLNLPFYHAKNRSKREVTEKDEEMIRTLMMLVEPTVVYAAGKVAPIQAIWPTPTAPIASASNSC